MWRPFFIAATLFSFAFFGSFAVAQSTGSGQPPSSNSPQGGSASSSPQTKSEPPAKPPEKEKDKKKPKKVWTNEEVGSLTSTVSVVGDPAAATPAPTAAPTADGTARSAARGSADAERYRRQLAPLRSELAELDRQIREVKSRGAQGAAYNNTSLDKLEERRRAVELKIDAIEEDARRHGIAPGDLR